MMAAPKPGDTVTLAPESSSVPEHQRQVAKERAFKTGAIRSGVSTVRNASVSDVKKPAGTVLGLIALNFMWTVWRTTVTQPTHLLPSIMRSAAGLWFVALGALVVAEINPQLAVLFMVLVTVGNIVSDNASNQLAISALNRIFTGKA